MPGVFLGVIGLLRMQDVRLGKLWHEILGIVIETCRCLSPSTHTLLLPPCYPPRHSVLALCPPWPSVPPSLPPSLPPPLLPSIHPSLPSALPPSAFHATPSFVGPPPPRVRPYYFMCLVVFGFLVAESWMQEATWEMTADTVVDPDQFLATVGPEDVKFAKVTPRT